jgi:transcriptional regulator with XRE-family HTH domain
MTDNRDDLAYTIGRRVALLRNRRQWTQWQLAYAVGVHPNTVSRIEAGKNTPSIHVLAAIGAALGVNPGDLLPHWYEGQHGAHWRY